MYLAIHNQPFHKHLTRISPSFVGKSSRPTMDGKPADSPSVRPGTGKGKTSIHIPFGTARQEGVFARPAAAWAAQRKQSIHRKSLFISSVGAASSSDVMSLRNTNTKLLSSGKHPAWSQRNRAQNTTGGKSRVALPNSSRAPGKAQVGGGLLEFALLWVPLLRVTTGWLPEQRKRLGMGWTEKGVGKNPRNTKPNSKLYSANQFFDQKIQNRENHKVQKLF